ncbi:MAG: glycosyl transferase [Sedimenticola sp.]|nr:MAG: glycosyl transferase [Sedimenticola sp.]
MVYLLWLGVFAVSCLLAYRFSRPDSWLHILDQPNHRSLHASPVPRSGGVAVVLAILAGGGTVYLQNPSADLTGIAAGFLGVSIIGFADDIRNLRARYRLFVQMASALAMILSGLRIEAIDFPGGVWALTPVVGGVLSLLFIIWMTNLYNFMDGMDGLAGSMALFGFAALAVLGWLAGDMTYMMLNGIIAAASLGFLVWNIPPARLFLGDAGSYGLGFLSAGMLIWGENLGIFPLWIGLLIFSPFIMDATSTLFLRLFRGEKIWEAHREHAYQRAVRSGLGHRTTLAWAVSIILAAGVSGILLKSQVAAVQWPALWVWGIFYLALFWYVRK